MKQYSYVNSCIFSCYESTHMRKTHFHFFILCRYIFNWYRIVSLPPLDFLPPLTQISSLEALPCSHTLKLVVSFLLLLLHTNMHVCLHVYLQHIYIYLYYIVSYIYITFWLHFLLSVWIWFQSWPHCIGQPKGVCPWERLIFLLQEVISCLWFFV